MLKSLMLKGVLKYENLENYGICRVIVKLNQWGQCRDMEYGWNEMKIGMIYTIWIYN